jgi:TonB family protein
VTRARASCAAAALVSLLAATAGAPSPSASAEAALAAGGRSGPGLEDALPPSPTLAERLEEIRRRVQDAVVYPDQARRRGLSGVTRIRFAVGGDGHAREVETVATSGHALLDRAAEQGAREAGALPYVYGRVEVPVRFALEGR